MLRPVVAALLVFGASALACSVPVFRYALDRWEADRFRLEVPASALSPQRLLDSLGANAEVNLDIVRDSAGSLATDARLFFPGHHDEPLWRGAADDASLKRLASSPARAEIARRIVAGDTAVWIIAAGADGAADDAAAGLEKRLRFLEQSIALPRIDPNDPTSKLGPGPEVAVKFTTLRVRRDDPVEAEFLRLLAGPKAAAIPAKATFFAPVFGRGRVLGAWPAAAMDGERITEAMQFLCGACSCEVKALNPGWDMLVQFDWQAALEAFGGAPAVPLTRVATVPPAVAIAPAPATAAPPKNDSAMPLLLTVSAVLALISSGFVFGGRYRSK